MKPLELLQQELDSLLRTRQKSSDALLEGKINIELHEQHIRNLTPMIEEYQYVIRVITRYA
jgi:hypothetical protein